ncbi:hypothetical protein N9X24_00645 [Rickettsiales bacterium]|nr:hypothetical protein [Rickettsiales bacterium]
MNIIIRISLILFLFIIASCAQKHGADYFRYARTTSHFEEDLKDADPDFKLGWDHGCETGAATGSNTFYKMFYESNKQDGWKLANSPTYGKAWKYGFWYCYREEYIDQKSGIWISIFGGLK